MHVTHTFPLEQTEGPAHGRGEGSAVDLILPEKARSLVTVALTPGITISHLAAVYVRVVSHRIVLAQSPVSVATIEDGNATRVGLLR